MGKYGNTRSGGFGSKLEHAVYSFLEAEYGSENIQCQSKVYLTDARILYIADFKVTDKTGVEFWAEAKGVETATWRIKKKLWTVYGPGELRIYMGNYRRIYLDETLQPKA